MKTCMFFIISLSISTPIEACFATRNAATAVVGDDDNSSSSTEEPVTDVPTDSPTEVPTDAPTKTCSPTALTYGTNDGADMVDVTNSGYVTDGSTIATMSVSCSADAGNFVDMTLEPGYLTPDTGFIPPVITIMLTCSYTDNVWRYLNAPVEQVTCFQAPLP